MKTLGKIKLNQFSKDELNQRKLNALKGGCLCYSVCEELCPALPNGSSANYSTAMSSTVAFY